MVYVRTVIYTGTALASSHYYAAPSSLGGGRILRRTLSVRLSVCPSVRLSVHPVIISVTWRHLANYNDTHVFFATH